METDYISREAVETFLRSRNYCLDTEADIEYVIERFREEIPAADVRPVKEGRWVKARGSWCAPGGDPVWECSECGKGVHVYGIEHGTYGSDIADGQWVSCPNCGAKMGETP